MSSKIIALDCDGVLLNYNEGWGHIYQKFTNKSLQIQNPNAYHATDYWGVQLEGRHKEDFFSFFNQHGWLNLPPLEGAIEATHKLKEHGYKIFIVTSMPKEAEKDREVNLKKLGFAFDSVIATGSHKTLNPKKQYIEALNPHYFVDDLLKNFKHIETDLTKFVFIKPEKSDYEQSIEDHIKYETHENLLTFVNRLIQKKPNP